jgi:hypothetical protein
MNDSKNKGGRPTKGKVDHVSVPPSDPVFPALARRRMDRLSVDPTWTEGLAEFFGPVITGKATEKGKAYAGAIIANAMEKASAVALAELFSRIMAMKKEAGSPATGKHRHWHVLRGYLDYLSETESRQPSKPELKDYLLARKSIYKNLPDELDKPGWTEAWKGAGLKDLANR